MERKEIKVKHPEYEKEAIIHVYFLPNGDIVLSGLGWYEAKQYLEVQKYVNRAS